MTLSSEEANAGMESAAIASMVVVQVWYRMRTSAEAELKQKPKVPCCDAVQICRYSAENTARKPLSLLLQNRCQLFPRQPIALQLSDYRSIFREHASEKTATGVTLIRSDQINVTVLSFKCSASIFSRVPGVSGAPAIPDLGTCRRTNPKSGDSK